MLSNWPNNNPCTSRLLALAQLSAPILTHCPSSSCLTFLSASHPLFHLSLFLMLCHYANEEEQKEKGEMNLGHRRPCISSPHSATIKRKLIWGLLALPFPLAPSPDGWTGTHTQSRVSSWIHPTLGLSILSHKAAGAPTHWVHWDHHHPMCMGFYVRLFNLVSQFLEGHDCNLEKTLNFNWQFRLVTNLKILFTPLFLPHNFSVINSKTNKQTKKCPPSSITASVN